MATKSIIKNIVFRDKKSAAKFIKALDKAQTMITEPAKISKTVNFVEPDQIDQLFIKPR
jgi:hypothetical protein